MRHALLASAFLLAALPACETSVTGPLPGGVVEIEAEMPYQDVAHGASQAFIVIEEMQVHLTGAALSTDSVRCTGCVVPSGWQPGTVQLRSDQRIPWAAFDDAEGARWLHLRLEPTEVSVGELAAGSSMLLQGMYMGELLPLLLPMEMDLVLPLPEPVADSVGQRLRLVLDPTDWLYDATADEVVRIEDLTPPNPDPAEVARVADLIRASIRLEPAR